jgi:hypothetical protein
MNKTALKLGIAMVVLMLLYVSRIDRTGKFVLMLPLRDCAVFHHAAGPPYNGQSTPPSGPVIPITANALSAAFQANPTRADETYTGKELQVSGTVHEIDDDLGVPVVRFDTTSTYFVECAFDIRTAVAGLYQGEAVTIDGTGSGVALDIVTLSHCSLVK